MGRAWNKSRPILFCLHYYFYYLHTTIAHRIPHYVPRELIIPSTLLYSLTVIVVTKSPKLETSVAETRRASASKHHAVTDRTEPSADLSRVSSLAVGPLRALLFC